MRPPGRPLWRRNSRLDFVRVRALHACAINGSGHIEICLPRGDGGIPIGCCRGWRRSELGIGPSGLRAAVNVVSRHSATIRRPRERHAMLRRSRPCAAKRFHCARRCSAKRKACGGATAGLRAECYAEGSALSRGNRDRQLYPAKGELRTAERSGRHCYTRSAGS